MRIDVINGGYQFKQMYRVNGSRGERRKSAAQSPVNDAYMPRIA